jgi:hypothetical protein
MRLAAMVALIGIGGCSFIGVSGPSQRANDHPIHCTESLVLPIVDTMGATLSGALTAGAVAVAGYCVANPNACIPDRGDHWPLFGLAIPPLVVSTAYLTSAIYGFHRVSRCREARSSKPAIQQQQRQEPPTAAEAMPEQTSRLSNAARD